MIRISLNLNINIIAFNFKITYSFLEKEKKIEVYFQNFTTLQKNIVTSVLKNPNFLQEQKSELSVYTTCWSQGSRPMISRLALCAFAFVFCWSRFRALKGWMLSFFCWPGICAPGTPLWLLSQEICTLGPGYPSYCLPEIGTLYWLRETMITQNGVDF